MPLVFSYLKVREARQFALDNPEDFSVHLHKIITLNAPACFRRAIANDQFIAHVFSQDADLLKELAFMNGIKRFYLDKAGTDRQHIDMCGSPLLSLLTELDCPDRLLEG